ncbi:MAG: dihydrodipicolinate synthase family protein [Sandaracinaceae bacterium]|nr:dihydrodipicolinate synthase family protein [Sandaracinaceae bacterium]
MLKLSGVIPALVTPFRDGRIDEDALRALIERAIEGGVGGLVPCGTTGESVAPRATSTPAWWSSRWRPRAAASR